MKEKIRGREESLKQINRRKIGKKMEKMGKRGILKKGKGKVRRNEQKRERREKKERTLCFAPRKSIASSAILFLRVTGVNLFSPFSRLFIISHIFKYFLLFSKVRRGGIKGKGNV